MVLSKSKTSVKKKIPSFLLLLMDFGNLDQAVQLQIDEGNIDLFAY